MLEQLPEGTKDLAVPVEVIKAGSEAANAALYLLSALTDADELIHELLGTTNQEGLELLKDWHNEHHARLIGAKSEANQQNLDF